MPSATLTTKGQTTIPKQVRDHLGIRSGDRLDFVILADGTVVVKPGTTHVSELKGLLYRKEAKPVSVEDMKKAVRKRAAKRSLPHAR
jgi:AbrB family looped-hinge helix DNA binding protein